MYGVARIIELKRELGLNQVVPRPQCRRVIIRFFYDPIT